MTAPITYSAMHKRLESVRGFAAADEAPNDLPSKLHKRLESVRGFAALHQCVDCGNPARDWSLVNRDHLLVAPDGREYSLDLDAYEPRCRSCHMRLDRGRNECPAGHPLTPDNLVATQLRRGRRECRACHLLRRVPRDRERRELCAAAAAALGIPVKEYRALYGWGRQAAETILARPEELGQLALWQVAA